MGAYCILVLSQSEALAQLLREQLPRERFGEILFSSSLPLARRLIASRGIDLLIIDMPLEKESGIRFAAQIAQRSALGILLLMPPSLYHSFAARMEETGIPALAKPLSHRLLLQSVSLLCTTQTRLTRYARETLVLQDKMKEIQTINQAKWQLVKKRGFSEEEAHRYLLKTAMDHCCSKYEIAKQIIKENQQGGSV